MVSEYAPGQVTESRLWRLEWPDEDSCRSLPRLTEQTNIPAMLSHHEDRAGTVLHHPRRHAPEKKPVNGAQPLGPHHDQIGMVFGGHLHDLFSWLPKLTQRLGRKSRLDQLPHALFD